MYVSSSNIYDFDTGRVVTPLNNCDLVLFVACNTAATDKPLHKAAVRAGATHAVGFTQEINCNEASEWLENFFEYRKMGYGVITSAQYAADDVGRNSSVQSVDPL